MNNRLSLSGILLLLALTLSASSVIAQNPIGAAFTYQGFLKEGGVPANAAYDFEFRLYDAETDGNMINNVVSVSGLAVSSGLFTAQVDFGSEAFTGDARWLEISVRPTGSTGDYTTLSPRQPITPAPYALYAPSAGSVPWNGLANIPPAAGDVTGTYPAMTITGLQNQPVTSTRPITGQTLQWNGNQWTPVTPTDNFPNQPPVAILQANPSVIYQSLRETAAYTVVLSLSLSYDPEGEPLTYAFDPTGRALGMPTSYSNAVTTTAVYSLPGDYLAAGWVQDNTGAFNLAHTLVSVYRLQFQNIPVHSGTGHPGHHPSLLVVNGNPAIAYYNPIDEDLKYVRASDATGLTWGSPTTVDSTGNVGQYPSLAIVNGNPAIVYDNDTNGALKYVRANDANGLSWGSPATIESHGSFASLAVINGNPAIAYNGVARFSYMRANDVNGASWGTPVNVENTTYGLDDNPSVIVVDGYPAIAYSADRNLKYVRANDANGNSWGTPLVLESDDAGRIMPSMVIVNNNPAIAYEHPDQELRYIRANNATGTSWGTPIILDYGGFPSLTIVNGKPAIAYFGYLWKDLNYIQATNVVGSQWGAPSVVDSNEGFVGYYPSLAVVDRRPAITYHDFTNSYLRFAIPTYTP